MSFGLIALLVAVIGAVWLLVRLASGRDRADGANMTILKAVVWLGLVAALFAAKLWPLAFMVLMAAGGVMAIEMWRDRSVPPDEAVDNPTRPALGRMTTAEAAQVLGVDEAATPEEIRNAHRRLIGQLHPDKGGTDYLASKINEARDFLLAKAESRLPPEQ